jgi:hypothetical protein
MFWKSDYLLFKQCFEIIEKGEHLTEKGLLEIKIIGLKNSLNLGLPNYLKLAFPNILLINRPEYLFYGIPDPFWISGFTSGDGSFHIVIINPDKKSRVFARFSIHLHVRELKVLKGIANYLNSYPSLVPFTVNRNISLNVTETDKKISIFKNSNSASLQITKFSDIFNIIIPFFNKYRILGIKSLDF